MPDFYWFIDDDWHVHNTPFHYSNQGLHLNTHIRPNAEELLAEEKSHVGLFKSFVNVYV